MVIRGYPVFIILAMSTFLITKGMVRGCKPTKILKNISLGHEFKVATYYLNLVRQN